MKKIFVLFVATILLLTTLSAAMGIKGLSEKRLTTGAYYQGEPAIYGDIVVWTDYRNGELNSDIYGMNIKTGQEFPICTAASYQVSPAIYGDIVVWQDYRSGNADIYGKNINTGGDEFPICTEDGAQYFPAIYGDVVVWQDQRSGNADIYLAYLDVVGETAKKSLPIAQIMKILGFWKEE
jgi:beta propeller repeat protein